MFVKISHKFALVASALNLSSTTPTLSVTGPLLFSVCSVQCDGAFTAQSERAFTAQSERAFTSQCDGAFTAQCDGAFTAQSERAFTAQ